MTGATTARRKDTIGLLVRVRHEREENSVNSQQSKCGMNHYSLQYNIQISICPVFMVQLFFIFNEYENVVEKKAEKGR